MPLINTSLTDYFRCEDRYAAFTILGELSGDQGYFRFGPDTLCYGQSTVGSLARFFDMKLEDVSKLLLANGSVPALPFHPVQVADAVRREHYELSMIPLREKFAAQEWVREAYYFVRNLLPDSVRRALQRAYFSDWQRRKFPAWPVDFSVDRLHEKLLLASMEAAGVQRVPFIWFWPQGAPACLILTHDVESSEGRDFSSQLMDLDDSYGFKASFQVIPEERYEVPDSYFQEICSRGYEFNVHDLNHDGRLYRRRQEFLRRAEQINRYARLYRARGFRAGAMYRIQDWYDAYEFSYDMSVPNVAHLEPKRGGCCTVFPYFVGKILELPLTTCQDYSIFYILQDFSLDLWKQQTSLIRERNGMISILAHPDYLTNQQARSAYGTLLAYLRHRVDGEGWWAALPGDVDDWWRARRQMKLAPRGDNWEITGPESDRARLAYAVREGERLRFELAAPAIPDRGAFATAREPHLLDSTRQSPQ